MRMPIMQGVIDRRILANFRVDPEVLANVLPSPFRPKLVNGKGIAGICLIRLKHIRPRFFPAFLGISSENAAHQIAVEWDHNGETKEGVYIPRRDTSSRLNTLVGGRLFPGVHHHARYQVRENGDHYSVVLDSDDTHVAVEGQVTSDLPNGSVFGSLQDASDFFKRGSLGYSVTRTSGTYDGLELRTLNWHVEPLSVDQIESSFFDDSKLFPAGSVEFDCGLLMRNINHQWHGRPTLCGESLPRPQEARSKSDVTMTAMNGTATAESAPVVLFDGVCNLCNSSVNFLIDHDEAGRLRFASLQSEAARRLLAECGIDVPEGDPDSMLLVEGGRVYEESTAAIRTARYLRWPYRWGYVFIVVPRPIRDVFYRLLARNRYRWFGREDSCRIPTADLRGRLLPEPAESCPGST